MVKSTKKSNTSEFISKASEVHSGKYIYSAVEYTNSKSQVTIICPNHGAFRQKPNCHLSGKGCQECGGVKRITLDAFYEKANKIHVGKYTYTVNKWVGLETIVGVTCKHHGNFNQKAKTHLMGHGCPYCGGIAKLTTAVFISRAIEVHGDTYDYSLVNYTSSHSVVDIICKTHGKFKQKAYGHLAGKGCKKCTGLETLTTEQFISRSVLMHGDAYDYTESICTGSRRKVKIICKTHGAFYQEPASHMSGQGCRRCAKHGFQIDKPATFYLFKINESILGFGITNDFKTRHTKHKSTFKKHNTNHELLQTFNCSGHQALAIETHLKQTYEIIDTGIEGFRREATEIKHLPNILQDIKNLLDTI